MLVRAAAVRGLDYSVADRFDRRWWVKTSLITDELERQANIESLRLRLQSTTRSRDLILPMAAEQPAAAKQLIDECDNLERELVRLHTPWIKFPKRLSLQETAKQMSASYADHFMDPSSPEFDDELNRLQAYWDRKPGRQDPDW